LKERAIYRELNKLKNGDKILMGLVWCPKKYRGHLDRKLEEMAGQRNMNCPQMNLIPNVEDQALIRPTFIETNDFTWPF
jgi:vacuolar-type H+-ATPase subunit I/STV1